MLTLALLAVVVVVGTALVWKGSVWLEGAANQLSAYYGLPAIVQGAIVAAVGSSFPELASIVLATLLHGEFELGVAAVIGSALFNILIIPALAGLVQDTPLQASRDLVYKEAQFYLLSLVALLLAFSLTVIYFPTTEDPLRGEFTPVLAVLLVVLYGLYVFVQYSDIQEYDAGTRPSVTVGKQWGILIAGLVLILLGVEGLIYAALELGELFDTSPFLWGLLIIAISTSLPDAFISIKAARAHRDSVSLGNVFGSNVFDLLVVVPAGVLIAPDPIVINFDRTGPMMGFLVIATIAVFVAARTDLEITDREAYALISLYGIFVVWMLLESVGLLAILD